MDNQSARLIIAIQLRDLDQLEEVGGLDKAVIASQREQLKTDATIDHLALESSRRLASSMARAVQEDSALISRTTTSPQIDDAMFCRLAALNQLPAPSADLTHSIPDLSPKTPPHLILASQAVLSRVSSQQDAVAPVLPRKRSHSTDTSVECLPRKKLQRHTHKAANNCDICPGTEASSPPKDVLTPTDCKPPSAVEDPLPQKAECASCACEEIDQLIKVSCEHYYCRNCFEGFVAAILETPDGFPPCCCKIPFAFNVVAANASSTVFNQYQARQEEIRNATALYCGILTCVVRINSDKIKGLRATCIACTRDTCTQCRGEMPLKLEEKHICKKDPAREAVIALAKQEGWQACFKCGSMVSLNFGCHHMTCRCKAEFCYNCGTPWKKCNCGDYDEPRILDRANRGVGIRAARRAVRGLPADPRPREQQVAELQQRLHGVCDHNRFTWRAHTRDNPGRCDICEYEGWKYILPCESCPFTSCQDCHDYRGWTWGHGIDFGDLQRQPDLDSDEPSSEE